ncbi:putative Fcf2 pre-rRNA processing [Blattamonas nauphoetae]|uniref:Fcf2 pre-rRNA processing n=1 Tax=Blattamonas nauphoetae TaxID=2049346 RepID=A0ABQ9XWM1_9EUKA|nr:putative Fcf2 pre-rRNA processing [Blattamonas nauphoetae]
MTTIQIMIWIYVLHASLSDSTSNTSFSQSNNLEFDYPGTNESDSPLYNIDTPIYSCASNQYSPEGICYSIPDEELIKLSISIPHSSSVKFLRYTINGEDPRKEQTPAYVYDVDTQKVLHWYDGEFIALDSNNCTYQPAGIAHRFIDFGADDRYEIHLHVWTNCTIQIAAWTINDMISYDVISALHYRTPPTTVLKYSVTMEEDTYQRRNGVLIGEFRNSLPLVGEHSKIRFVFKTVEEIHKQKTTTQTSTQNSAQTSTQTSTHASNQYISSATDNSSAALHFTIDPSVYAECLVAHWTDGHAEFAAQSSMEGDEYEAIDEVLASRNLLTFSDTGAPTFTFPWITLSSEWASVTDADSIRQMEEDDTSSKLCENAPNPCYSSNLKIRTWGQVTTGTQLPLSGTGVFLVIMRWKVNNETDLSAARQKNGWDGVKAVAFEKVLSFGTDKPDFSLSSGSSGTHVALFAPIRKASLNLGMTILYTTFSSDIPTFVPPPSLRIQTKASGLNMTARREAAIVPVAHNKNCSSLTPCIYTGPFTVTRGQVVRAIAVAEGYGVSGITEITITEKAIQTKLEVLSLFDYLRNEKAIASLMISLSVCLILIGAAIIFALVSCYAGGLKGECMLCGTDRQAVAINPVLVGQWKSAACAILQHQEHPHAEDADDEDSEEDALSDPFQQVLTFFQNTNKKQFDRFLHALHLDPDSSKTSLLDKLKTNKKIYVCRRCASDLHSCVVELNDPGQIALQEELQKTNSQPTNTIVKQRTLNQKKTLLKRTKISPDASLKGPNWFHMKSPQITPEIAADLKYLQYRRFSDKRRFYKSTGLNGQPEVFQMGTVVEGTGDFYGARLTKKQRKQSLLDEIQRLQAAPPSAPSEKPKRVHKKKKGKPKNTSQKKKRK